MKQKEYKFIAHITNKDMTTEDNVFIDCTASARCKAKKVAQKPDVESVHLYRIDKAETFNKIKTRTKGSEPMNVTEAMELLREILKVLDEIYHALVEKNETEGEG